KSGKSNWNYESTPQPGLNGRTRYFRRGKVLGGSSAINAMIVSRGNAGDYDNWQRLGNSKWSYNDCLPYFKKIERYPSGDESFRGHSGLVGITKSSLEKMDPISKAWIEGSIAAGHAFTEDYNCDNP